jgi:hypothetical protein
VFSLVWNICRLVLLTSQPAPPTWTFYLYPNYLTSHPQCKSSPHTLTFLQSHICAGPSPAPGPPVAPADPSFHPRLHKQGREGNTRVGQGSIPLKQLTSSAMLAFLWVAIHSSWVGGKVRAAPEPCCWARPMACMRRC